MPRENVEIVRRLLQSVNDGNLDAALREVHPDARLDWSGSDAPDSGVYDGHAGWLGWITGRREDLGYVRFEATDVVEQPPDSVVTEVTVQSRGRAIHESNKLLDAQDRSSGLDEC